MNRSDEWVIFWGLDKQERGIIKHTRCHTNALLFLLLRLTIIAQIELIEQLEAQIFELALGNPGVCLLCRSALS
jgi:hypothetical protein